MRVRLVVIMAAVMLCTFIANAQTTTQPGLFFTISNSCTAPVSGFAVGDEVCLLQVGSAVYTRAIFQGTMLAGEQKFAMACAGKDGNGTVIFVPSVSSSGVEAVVVTVKPNQVVNIPQTFCPNGGSERQLLRRR